MKQPSKERGCDGKMQIRTKAITKARKMALKHGKQYGLYLCPHCDFYHLTTKINKADQYLTPLTYVTPPIKNQ